MGMKRVVCGAVVLMLGLMLWTVGQRVHGESANMILNGDFAVDSDGDGMADHWQFSGDANVKVTWTARCGGGWRLFPEDHVHAIRGEVAE